MARRVLYCTIHSLLITSLIWLYVNSWFTIGIEEGWVKKVLIVRHLLLNTKEFPTDSLLLINTSKDLSLASDPDDYGKVTLTDREMLCRFFRRINSSQAKPKFVLCDLLFDIPTPFDSALQGEFNQFNHIVIPYLPTEGQSKQPLFRLPAGVGQYTTNTGSFLKLSLLQSDSLKSIPVVMDELLNKKLYRRKAGFTFCNNQLSLNYVIPGFYVRPFHIFQRQDYRLVNLGELTDNEDAESFKRFVDGRYLVIGNFYTDLHETVIGNMPGALILLNTYLSLRNDGHIVPLGWWLMLIVCFGIISYIAFYRDLPKPETHKKNMIYKWGYSFLSRYISFFGMVLLVSVLSLLLFNIHVNILIVSFYFSLIYFLVQKKKNAQTA